MASPQTVHGQRVRAGLQDRVLSAGIANLRAESPAGPRIPGWCSARDIFPREFRRQSCRTVLSLSGSFDNCVDQRSGGGFSVGSGYGRRVARISRDDRRNLPPRSPTLCALRVPEPPPPGRGTAEEGAASSLAMATAPRPTASWTKARHLRSRSLQREKQAAGLYLARVASDLQNFRISRWVP